MFPLLFLEKILFRAFDLFFSHRTIPIIFPTYSSNKKQHFLSHPIILISDSTISHRRTINRIDN